MESTAGERLHKILAAAGLGSRRACEELILAGRVSVDGKVVNHLGTVVDPSRNEIRCDGEILRPEPKVYFLVHKPRGVVCTAVDPQRRTRVIDLFRGICQRIYTVGRLDVDSQGLMIVTNDGELTNLLTHPRYGVSKTYRVVIRGALPQEKLERARQGVWIAEGKTAPMHARLIKRTRQRTILEVTIREGMNREIRRVFARLGHPVSSLLRIRIGGLVLGDLQAGQYKPISRQQILDAMTAAEPAEKPPRRQKRDHSRGDRKRPRPPRK